MKFFTLALPILASTLSVFGASAFIASPASGGDIVRGSNVTIEVAMPNSLSSTQTVAIALGLRSCEPSTTSPSPSCEDVPSSEWFGTVLYSGPFTPSYHREEDPGMIYPYQNFSVFVPSGVAKGRGVLSVAQFVLLGAGPQTVLNLANNTVNIV